MLQEPGPSFWREVDAVGERGRLLQNDVLALGAAELADVDRHRLKTCEQRRWPNTYRQRWSQRLPNEASDKHLARTAFCAEKMTFMSAM